MKWISDLIDLIFPRHCVVCGEVLSAGEKDICLNCLFTLPKVEALRQDNIEKVFWGKFDIERAASYIYYQKNGRYNNILHHIKYRNHPEVGERLAQQAAKEFEPSGLFNDIDYIVPLPLSAKRKRKRGYNQCDYIAEGISSVTGIPVLKDAVTRSRDNTTQTQKSREERWKNVEGIFSVTKPQLLCGKHILLVDDILTTGATLESCARSIQAAADCKISIFTLAYTDTPF